LITNFYGVKVSFIKNGYFVGKVGLVLMDCNIYDGFRPYEVLFDLLSKDGFPYRTLFTMGSAPSRTPWKMAASCPEPDLTRLPFTSPSRRLWWN
jgi:hypothetical protein